MDIPDDDDDQIDTPDDVLIFERLASRLLSRADPLYSILGQGIWTVEDDSSTDEENPEKIKEDYVDSDSTELQGGTSSAQTTLLGRNEVKHNYVNVWKYIRNREMGLDTKGKRSVGFSEPEKSRVFSRYLPNAVKEVVQHSAKVFCGSYSQDGSVFMSASQDCHIKLYETSSGKLKEFQDVVAQNVGWSIVDTAYSHDQRHLIYSSWSSDIYLCDIAGGYERSHVALHMRSSNSSEIITEFKPRLGVGARVGDENRIERR